MAKVICIMGESGSGKTTSMRNLDPDSTYYIDSDRKGLSWKGWKKQYNEKKKIISAATSRTELRRGLRRFLKNARKLKPS